MTLDLEERLRNYRDTLDDAITAGLSPTSERTVATEPPRHRSLALVAAAAVIAVVGLGAVAVVRNDRSSGPIAPVDTLAPDVTLAPPTATARVTTTAPATTLAPIPPAVIDRYAFGDSVMLGAAPALVAAGFTVNATESRQFQEAGDVFAQLSDEQRLGDVVVISVGTNGSIGDRAIESTMAALADVDQVVVLTVAAPDREWIEGNNELIRSLPARYPNVTVLDWAAQATTCPGDCFYSDGIHLNSDGQQFYADLIETEVDALTRATMPTNSPPTFTPPVVTLPVPQLGDVPTFTPLLLESVPDGYWLDLATFIQNPNGTTDGLVWYRAGIDGPVLQLHFSQPGGPAPTDPGPPTPGQSWDVDGRRVVNTTTEGGGLEGCRADYCAVAVRWDEQTAVTVSWQPFAHDNLLPDHTLDELVGFVGDLHESRLDSFRPVVTWNSKMLSRLTVASAGPEGVMINDGRGGIEDAIPAAHKALVLPDGRMLLQTTELASPGELFVYTPRVMTQDVPMDAFWPTGIADDGTVRIDIQDVATVDGVPTLLFEEITGPCTGLNQCDGALRAVTLIGGAPPVTVYEFPYSAFESGIKAQLSNAPYAGLVVGQYVSGGDIIPIITTLSGDPPIDVAELGLEDTYSNQPVAEFATTDGFIAWILNDELVIHALDDQSDDLRIPLDEIRRENDWVIDGLQFVAFGKPDSTGSMALITFIEATTPGHPKHVAEVNLATHSFGFHDTQPDVIVTLGNR